MVLIVVKMIGVSVSVRQRERDSVGEQVELVPLA